MWAGDPGVCVCGQVIQVCVCMWAGDPGVCVFGQVIQVCVYVGR